MYLLSISLPPPKGRLAIFNFVFMIPLLFEVLPHRYICLNKVCLVFFLSFFFHLYRNGLVYVVERDPLHRGPSLFPRAPPQAPSSVKLFLFDSPALEGVAASCHSYIWVSSVFFSHRSSVHERVWVVSTEQQRSVPLVPFSCICLFLHICLSVDAGSQSNLPFLKIM